MSLSLQNVKGLSFDLDDTLYDNEPVIRNAFKELYNYLLTHYPDIRDHHSFEGFLNAAKTIKQTHPKEANLGKLRRMHIRQILASSGYPSDIKSTQNNEAYTVFWRARQKVTLYPEVHPLLKQLSSQLPLVSVSNGNACTKSLGIDHYLQHSINAIDTGKAKPHPSMFLLACKKLAIEPEQLVHIGDNIDMDIAGATNAGCRSIWLNWHDLKVPNHHASLVINNLKALLDINFL